MPIILTTLVKWIHSLINIIFKLTQKKSKSEEFSMYFKKLALL